MTCVQSRSYRLTALVAALCATTFAIWPGQAAAKLPLEEEPPANTSSPTISGTDVAGETLTCSRGSWQSDGPITYSNEWKHEGSTTVLGSSPTYTVQPGDAGYTLVCVVTAKNTYGTTTAEARIEPGNGTFTWTGAAQLSFPTWSEPQNWLAGKAPSGAVAQLAFPSVGAGCDPLTQACYESTNNIDGLTVGALAFESETNYVLGGDAITLGPGGLYSGTGLHSGNTETTLNLPITLGSSQTWTVANPDAASALRVESAVTGSSPLHVELLGSGASLELFEGYIEAGPVTIAGTAGNLGYVGLFDSSLNAVDEQPVDLTDVFFEASGTIGPLAAHGATIAPDVLSVNGGVTLDSTTKLFMALGPGPLTATGPVALGNATLLVDQQGYSANVAPQVDQQYYYSECPNGGEQFALVTSSSSLSGTFAGLPDGTTFEISCGVYNVSIVKVRINYTAHSAILTVLTSPSDISPPTVQGNAVEGETLTEGHGSWTENPTSYLYQWERCDSAGSNCAGIPEAEKNHYKLEAADVGHTIRVAEDARNALGTSPPAYSAATAVVTAAGAAPVSPPYVPPQQSYVPPQATTGGLGVNLLNPNVYVPGAPAPGIGEEVFTGTVVPGSLATRWYFEYGPTRSGGYQIPGGPAYASQALPGPVSIATPTNPTAPGVVTAYQLWYYRLVATDGRASVAGQWIPFVPENVSNPQLLKPLNQNGSPGKYKLTITCQASPCTALATHDGTPQSTLKSVGEPLPHGPTPGGSLEISSFNPSDGSFTGTVTLVGGIIAPEVPTGTYPGFEYNATFSVSGNIDLSVLELKGVLVKDNQLPPADYLCGQDANIKCGVSNFDLGGTATYAALGAQGQTVAEYKILGQGNPGGNGDKWELCWENQSTCPPNTGYTKSAAFGIVAGGLGWVGLIPSPLSESLGVFSAVMGLISSDPPESRYNRVTHAGTFRPAHIAAGRGLSRSAAAAATKLTNGLAQASLSGAAFLNAMQRYEGAQQAGKAPWVSRQAQAALHYGHQLVGRCRQLVSFLKRRRRVLAASPLNADVSAQRIGGLLHSAKHHGLPGSVTHELQRLGLEPATIGRTAAGPQIQTPRRGATALGPVLTARFSGELEALARALTGYLRGLEQPAPR